MKAGRSLFVLFFAVMPALGGDRPDPAALAKEIDRRVNDKLKAQHVSPTAQADDATFFRRINLALTGRIPDAAAVRAFLADTSANKRARAVDRLLDSSAFVNYFAKAWRGWLLQGTSADVADGVPELEAWLNARFGAAAPLDKIVTELLTFPLDGRQAPANSPLGENAASPNAFYTAHEAKPESLAATTSRVFLGVRLECAQCHNHPFARWKQDQFWGLAAFFAGVQRSPTGGLREAPGRRELPIPNADRAAAATFLDDREPEWQYKKSPRVTLATWLTAPENPFFAKALANRLWWFLFGIGLVEAVDDFHDQNPPSHAELLDDLARSFVQSGFDAKFLLRAICLSETFGRASTIADPKNTDVRLFDHFAMQALSPDQLYDSLVVVLGRPPEKPSKENPSQESTIRRQFSEAFASSGPPTAATTSILQALTLMNGDLVNRITKRATILAAGTHPGQMPAEKVEALYLAVHGRLPQPRELQRALSHLKVGADNETRTRYADVLWALLNSLEFRTNH
jgi:Protein of unknown function (DUF1549)/Protein of unknown function (DUF1553)